MAAIALLALGAYVFYSGRAVTHAPGILAPEAPRQTPVTAGQPIRHRGYHLTPVAHFSVEARVLGKKAYRRDPNARLALYDLAVGWGPMSDTAVLDHLSIRQQQRAYTWENAGAPLSTREVILHSTNMHLIPASDAVAAALVRLRPGHLVRLRGRLVDVLANDGSRWRTSRTRMDAGMGACEIVWVEALEIL